VTVRVIGAVAVDRTVTIVECLRVTSVVIVEAMTFSERKVAISVSVSFSVILSTSVTSDVCVERLVT
jgi:hypothetical protein